MTSNGEESPKKLLLYSFFMSSCSFRVRIALNLKGLDYEYKAINLFKNEQHSPEFLKINPIGYVPALVDGDIVLADSLAIILYLEEKYPNHPLLPHDLAKKAINYQAANIVSSSIQPLLNVSVMNLIEENVGQEAKISWIKKQAGKGFTALEKLLKDHAGKYATGDEISLADVFLAPQIIGLSQRFNFDMSEFPLLSRLNEAYKHVAAIQDAMPEKQPDFPIN
ncbi:glutathione S-transferase zeta class [Lactuca sativa]|uniref:glutathione S-transferase zeta class n=1 Tax=Lactuca sativa TaxID=4236 RepID=UPI000CD9057C|nr:glutathione S-transferase zeta class [Lactuca sativa]